MYSGKPSLSDNIEFPLIDTPLGTPLRGGSFQVYINNLVHEIDHV